MKLATLTFLALSTLGVMMAGPLAAAGFLPAQPVTPMLEGNDDDRNEEEPPKDPCACHPSISANGQAGAGIRAYWTGWQFAGRCNDGECGGQWAPCHWAGMFTVQNILTTPQKVEVLPGHPGTAGNGVHVLMPGQWVDKTGVTEKVRCNDSAVDYLHITDMGPGGQLKQLPVYFNCSPCGSD